jgi:hypothetical protein
MIYPWEFNYQNFMDTHIRVSVSINGERKGSFAIVDDGTNMDVNTITPDGLPLVFKVEGHPRTTDKRMTVTELIDYVLSNYK